MLEIEKLKLKEEVINGVVHYTTVSTYDIVTKINEVIDYVKARTNPLLSKNPKPHKRLDLAHVSNLLKLGANTKLIGYINDSFENPNELFEVSNMNIEDLRYDSKYIHNCHMDEGLGIGINPVMEEPNPKFQPTKATEACINRMEEAIATQDMDIAQYTEYKRARDEFPLQKESKWKRGDVGYFICFFEHDPDTWYVDDFTYLEDEHSECVSNIYKTREQAEACLEAVKKVMKEHV